MLSKLSIVAVTRNDNHGGDLNKRMQLFIDCLFAQSEKFKFFIEIVIVEWNPPKDRPPLIEILNMSRQTKFTTVKIVEVPPDIHMLYSHGDKLALFQMIGKNVGIRRASGEFILSTNIDIMFSDELFEYLATNDLEDGKIYRADRYDVANEIPLDVSDPEKLLFCQQNIIRKNKKLCTENMVTGITHSVYRKPEVDACERYNMPCIIHTNACGDFQLLSRNTWFKLRGYPEFDMYSMHIDSVFAYMAMLANISETVIGAEQQNAVTYHMEHDSGFRHEDTEPIEVRFRNKGIYCLDYIQLFAIALKMLKDETMSIINSEAWGMKDLQLKETVIRDSKAVQCIANVKARFNPQKVCDTNEWINIISEESKKYSMNFYGYSDLDEPLKIKMCKRYLNAYYRTTDRQNDRIYDKLMNRKVDIIAYGASSNYRKYFLPTISRHGIKVKYIVDNDSNKFGTDIEGVPICGRDALLKEDKEDVYIFITSMFYEEIKKDLIEIGFSEPDSFMLFDIGSLSMEFIMSYYDIIVSRLGCV